MAESEKKLLSHLKKRAKKQNPFETTNTEIVESTGLGASTVKIQLNLLHARGLIVRKYRIKDRKQVIEVKNN